MRGSLCICTSCTLEYYLVNDNRKRKERDILRIITNMLGGLVTHSTSPSGGKIRIEAGGFESNCRYKATKTSAVGAKHL